MKKNPLLLTRFRLTLKKINDFLYVDFSKSGGIITQMAKMSPFFHVTLFLLLACAKQGMPPGGPVDKTPPEVVRTIPVTGEMMVDPNTSVQIWFSEGIQSQSAPDNIFITPYVGEEVKYQFRGRRIKMTYPQPLDSNRTYVVTFGTGIKDYRNNGMEASFTLAFSTGPILDEGEITGQIYGVKDAKGIDVWAYTIEDGLDPDPSEREPKYIVQCGTQGEFKFSNISPGLYRLFALRDRMADRLYQAGEDEVGVTFRDVLLSRDGGIGADSLHFRMAREDTVGPSIIRIVSIDRHHLILRFDEPISSECSLASGSLAVIPVEDSSEPLSIEQIYLDPLNAQMVHVVTDAQAEGKKYTLSVTDLWDEAGNPVDTAYDEVLFNGIGLSDTTLPKLVQTDPRSGANLVGLKGVVRLIFSEAMDSTLFREGFSLKDTLEQPVEGTFEWKNLSEVTFFSSKPLESQWTYEVSILGKGVKDLGGNPLPDSLYRFQTLNGDTLSAISGTVTDLNTEAVGGIHVVARQIENSDITYRQILPMPGEYTFMDIFPGQYLLECFRDRDGNGRYSMGRPFPYQPSERFCVYKDTVKVRSKWPNQGNDIILPW